jgi:hypothetical protein
MSPMHVRKNALGFRKNSDELSNPITWHSEALQEF